jgi:hypothetical protein
MNSCGELEARIAEAEKKLEEYHDHLEVVETDDGWDWVQSRLSWWHNELVWLRALREMCN